jgi:hypothetical protein
MTFMVRPSALGLLSATPNRVRRTTNCPRLADKKNGRKCLKKRLSRQLIENKPPDGLANVTFARIGYGLAAGRGGHRAQFDFPVEAVKPAKALVLV